MNFILKGRKYPWRADCQAGRTQARVFKAWEVIYTLEYGIDRVGGSLFGKIMKGDDKMGWKFDL